LYRAIPPFQERVFAMANVLKKDRQLAVIHQLCEGSSVRSTSRITGVNLRTCLRILLKFGNACQTLLDEELRGLELRHVQCDEIWTFVAKKQGRLTAEERQDRADIGDIYLWTALDTDTKLLASYAVGKRSADMARRFMVDLASRLVVPKPHASDAHGYKAGGYTPIVQISTDAFAAYPEAVDLAFGRHALYGQLIKDYRNSDQPGRYAAPEMVGADRRVVFGNLDPDSICTSHVERNNLTIRTFMRRFTRLSLGFSKRFDNLAAAIAIHTAYYNFCRRHSTLRMTPAMAANVTGTLWSLEDLYDRAVS
jgi:IS1 family transposase